MLRKKISSTHYEAATSANDQKQILITGHNENTSTSLSPHEFHRPNTSTMNQERKHDSTKNTSFSRVFSSVVLVATAATVIVVVALGFNSPLLYDIQMVPSFLIEHISGSNTTAADAEKAPHITSTITTESGHDGDQSTMPHDELLLNQNHSLLLDCNIYKMKKPDFEMIQINTTELSSKKSVLSGGRNFFMSTHDPEKEVIAILIKKDGCFECNILYSLLYALMKSPNTTLIDIGGNIGLYSLHAASFGRNTVAFEPFQTNQEKFCQSILHNSGFRDKIKLVPAALTNDMSQTYVSFDKSMFHTEVFRQGEGLKNLGSMMVRGTNHKPNSGEMGKDYSMAITLDSFQNRTGILPTAGSRVVLKVDVEGYECKALSGAFDYLSKVDIEYVALEWSCKRIQQCSEDGTTAKIFNLFSKNGLSAYLYKKKWHKWIKVDMETDPQTWCMKKLFDIAFSKEWPAFN
jgi:FkbM family methyltransferase